MKEIMDEFEGDEWKDDIKTGRIKEIMDAYEREWMKGRR